MSLQVWLPLTKDLRQQGLSNVTVTNNGATFNSAGKLGGCYYFNRSTPNYLKIDNPFTTATNGISISFWIKIPSNASGNNQIVHIGNGAGWGNNRCTCFIYQGSSSLVFSCSNGTDSTSTQYGCKSSALTLNNWTHVTCTYSTGKMKIYLNGALDKDYTTTIVPSFANTSYIGVGAAPNAGEPATIYINDVRIYNHTLSQKEIKELAKGLVLHYPLDGHNEAYTPFGYQQLEYIEGNGSAYLNTNYKFNPETDACKVEFKGNDVTNNGMIFADSGGKYFWFYYYGTNGIRVYADNSTGQQGIPGITSDLNKHIMEYKNKHYYIDGVDKGSLSKTYTEDTNTINLFSYGGGNYGFKGRIYYTDIKRNGIIQKIYIPAKRLSDSKIGMYELINDEFFVSSSSTAFTAGPAIITPSNIYDTSGFCNNGVTVGNLSISDNTPRYKHSIYFNGSSYILTDSGTFSWFGFDKCTVTIWMKPTSTPSSWAGTFGIAHNNSASNKSFVIGNYGGTFTVQSANGNWVNIQSSTLPVNEWHHCVATLDGTTIKMYFDGELVNTYTTSWGSTTVASDTRVQVGIDLPGSDEIYQGYYSDARIYATVLSAEDILELYHTAAHIDNLGNTWVYQYNEI